LSRIDPAQALLHTFNGTRCVTHHNTLRQAVRYPKSEGPSTEQCRIF